MRNATTKHNLELESVAVKDLALADNWIVVGKGD
jgi:hypothetical protein